ncbi:MAG TPA: VWA domain-containing protein [Syntrophales bacterium]|nr:VWA domain-containing protein [Syntrophales bacterium]HPC01128.1 VWA domain-containing protein [Syntrophales bacterium]HRV42564.1 VWA domain-containing protein [Syntrophales bacterium]
MSFTGFVGHEGAKLALILNAVDGLCGGVLFVGEKGSGKSTLCREFRALLPAGTPFVELPLHATLESLVGGVDIETSVRRGERVFQEGLLGRAAGGFLYVDDINLLSPEIIDALIRTPGPLYLPGGAYGVLQGYRLLATMNPEEGEISPHLLDRFGMAVVWTSLSRRDERLEILKGALAGERPGRDEELRRRIEAARLRVRDIPVPGRVRDRIVETCAAHRLEGHRGEIFLFYAARAYGAFMGAPETTVEHVAAVSPLVLAHRSLRSPQEGHVHEDPPPAGNDAEAHGHRHDHPHEGDLQERGAPKGGEGTGCCGTDEGPGASAPREEVFDVGSAYGVRRFLLKRDRKLRRGSGRRTKTWTGGMSGRYVRSVLMKNDDVAVDATLRAAAPFQVLRGRREGIVIREEDLRFKRRERKTGHLVIFVVDGSGSMGAKRRMVETKGAVQSLLLNCYQKRDKVAMILFRRDRAELVLPPTSSAEAAAKRLRSLPVGGKTPLAAGLMAAYDLVRRVNNKSPETRFLVCLVTDGRANHSLTGLPVWEELRRLFPLLKKLPSTDYVVIDTEDKGNFLRADLAAKAALLLEADYYTFETLRAERLAQIVREKSAAAGP